MDQEVEDRLPTPEDYVAEVSVPLREWTSLGLPMGVFAVATSAPVQGPTMPWLTGPFLKSAYGGPWTPPTAEVVEGRLKFCEAVLTDLHGLQSSSLDRHFRLRTVGLLLGTLFYLALIGLTLVLSLQLQGAWSAVAVVPVAVLVVCNMVVKPRAAKRLRRREKELAFVAESVRAPWEAKPTLH